MDMGKSLYRGLMPADRNGRRTAFREMNHRRSLAFTPQRAFFDVTEIKPDTRMLEQQFQLLVERVDYRKRGFLIELEQDDNRILRGEHTNHR